MILCSLNYTNSTKQRKVSHMHKERVKSCNNRKNESFTEYCQGFWLLFRKALSGYFLDVNLIFRLLGFNLCTNFVCISSEYWLRVFFNIYHKKIKGNLIPERKEKRFAFLKYIIMFQCWFCLALVFHDFIKPVNITLKQKTTK